MAPSAADDHGPLAQSLPALRTTAAPESAAPTQHAQRSCKRNSLHVTELSQSPKQQRTVSAFNAASKDSDDHISIVVSELERAAAKGKEGSKDIDVVGEEPSADSCSCSAGWLLFSLGWVFFVPFVIGALLPIFNPSQRKVPHKRSAWIANMVLAVTYAIVGAVIIVLACNGTLHSQAATSPVIAPGVAGAADSTIFKGSTNSVIGPGF